MKILLISGMEQVAGTERATQQLANVLVEHRHTIHLLASDGPLIPAIEKLGVVIHLSETHGKTVFAIGKFFFDIFRLLREGRFDCVHLQMARPVPLVAVANYLAGRPSKIIWHARGLHTGTYKFIAHLFEALNVRCIANCRAEQDKLIKYGYNPDHIGYIYNLCKLEGGELSQTTLREQLNIPTEAIVIGSLSRLAKDRGVDYAIDYFHTLSSGWTDSRPIYLLIGGDGPERKHLEQMARSGVGSERIIFLGVVFNVAEFYATLDVFWNTPESQVDQGAGTGNTTIEAAFCRVPIVAHDVAGIGELIEDGVTGSLVQAGNKQKFIASTRALLSNTDYRAAIITQALNRVRAMCGKEQYIQKIENYYRDL